MAKLKFLRGSRENYDPITFKDCVYFALDTYEIIVDNKSYGSIYNENSLNTIINVEQGSQTGDLVFTYRDGTKSIFSIPLASSTENGLMSKDDKIKLDDVYERLSWVDLNLVD